VVRGHAQQKIIAFGGQHMRHPLINGGLGAAALQIGPWFACLASNIVLPAALAQSVDRVAAATVVEEVVVTSRRRSESLQSVPESITAFTESDIENARIQKFSDFVALTPNFEMFPTSSPGVFQMSIRGVSQANMGDAPVSMVVDGVTLPVSNSFTMPLFDVERIEVLKGPQGALYGQNAIGGAVVITTKQPTNELTGRLTASYGKGNETKLVGVVTGPIVDDRLLFRAAGYYSSFDGDVRYAYEPRELQNYLEDGGARVDLKFLATDTFTADLSLSYGKTRTGSGPLVPMTLSPASGLPNVPTDTLNEQLILGVPNQDFHTHTERTSKDASLKLVWDAGFAEVTSISAATLLDENNVQDLDVSHIPFVALTAQPQDVDAYSQEIRLTSRSDQRLRWIVGGFAQRIDRKLGQDVVGNLSLLTTGDTDPADAVYVPISNQIRDQELESYAAFAQLNYDILPELELTVAGRYDYDPRSQVTTSSGVEDSRLERTFRKFQPKVSISYKPTPRQTYYVTYAEGFRAGGFNGDAGTGTVTPVFDPEETTTYEAGAKFSLFDQRAVLSMAAYATEYNNQQLTLVQVTATSATQNIFTVKKSEIKGFELEAQARLIEGLDVGVGIGVQEGTIKQFGESLSGGDFDPSSFIGNDVPLLAAYTVTASVQYSHPIAGGIEAFVRTNLNRKGKLYWYADNRVSRSPFDLVNASAGLRGDRWDLTLYGTNIFDKQYSTLYFDNLFVGAPGGFDFAYLGEQSRYGMELTYRFGGR
jgi:iron complex outermembrane receptor protein